MKIGWLASGWARHWFGDDGGAGRDVEGVVQGVPISARENVARALPDRRPKSRGEDLFLFLRSPPTHPSFSSRAARAAGKGLAVK